MRAKLEVRSRKHPQIAQIAQIISGWDPEYPNYQTGAVEANAEVRGQKHELRRAPHPIPLLIEERESEARVRRAED